MATAGRVGVRVPAGTALIGDTDCSFVTPMMPPPDVVRDTGCTRIGGAGRDDRLGYQLACVPDASLDRQTPPMANEVCMTPPVDRQDYFVGSPVIAQAVADECWVLCSLSPDEPDFEEWLELDFELWLGRCADVSWL